MFHATFDTPDLTVFCRLGELGLVATGQRIERHLAVLECRVLESGKRCRWCGSEGISRGTQARQLAHVQFGGRPTILLVLVLVLVRVRRYRCTGCGRSWRQDMSQVAQPRSRLSRGAIAWALVALVVDHLTISRVRAGSEVSWHTGEPGRPRRGPPGADGRPASA